MEDSVMIYMAPRTIEEAAAVLEQPNVRVFAGGTDLIPKWRYRGDEPEVALDIKHIPGLTSVCYVEGTWVVGAAAPLAEIAAAREFREAFPGLSEATALIGSAQIQSRATWGGNVANAAPSADSVPSLIANRARALVRRGNTTRFLNVEEIATGPGSTALAPDEFIVEFAIDAPPARTADAYMRFIPRTEMDIAVVGVAARISLNEDGSCSAATIAMGAVAPTAIRVEDAEAVLMGRSLDTTTLASAAEAAVEACDPIDDKRGTADFRRKVAGVLVQRVVGLAGNRAYRS